MSSNYRVTVSPFGTKDETVSHAIATLHKYLWRQPSIIRMFMPEGHSDSYYRKQLNGGKSMSLPVFVRFLRILHWAGNRLFGGYGQRWVAEVLQKIANEFDLEVIPRGQRVETKPADAEQLEFAVASGETLIFFDQAKRDGFTDAEAYELALKVARLKREADDLLAIAHHASH